VQSDEDRRLAGDGIFITPCDFFLLSTASLYYHSTAFESAIDRGVSSSKVSDKFKRFPGASRPDPTHREATISEFGLSVSLFKKPIHFCRRYRPIPISSGRSSDERYDRVVLSLLLHFSYLCPCSFDLSSHTFSGLPPYLRGFHSH
jgi:hypothetical protein